jgi:ABC-2 type transport system ATP-binding protein
MLRIANYIKTYGSFPVLHIPQLDLAAGIYWLKGGNGTGKTTFLRSIAGLIPFEGTINATCFDLRKQRKAYTRNVSFAEAEPVYPSFLTGKDLLQFYLQTKGGDKERTKEIITRLEIDSYLQNSVATYSSGMLKKLSLLLAFTGEPVLVLLDEPLITLDTKAVDTLKQLIGEKSRQGVSFLISSHQDLQLQEPCEILAIQQKTIKKETHAAGA